jgi:flavin reductase (DIM6/NTAB) family NADH-FMN oxidoreductase RutF
MAKILVPFTEYFTETVQHLQEEGLLLATVGAEGKPNVMTIGWGTIGEIWGRPIFTVLVRPSRHSYSLIEQVSDFTVNVLPKELAAVTRLCGSTSGRDHDKFEAAHLTPIPSREVRAPAIQECVVHYECRILSRADLPPDSLVQSVRGSFYRNGDFHRVYFGEIVASYADEDAAARLRGSASGHQP